MRRAAVALLLLLSAGSARSQGERPAAGSVTIVDSLTQPAAADSSRPPLAVRDTNPSPIHPKKNPWLAVGLSAVAPGAGQIYAKSYWKLPLLWGLGGYWISQWADMQSKYKDYRSLYAQSLLTIPGGNGDLKKNRDFYRDERDKFAWYLGILYFLNLVDAYVGANLYDFDVGPELGVNGSPAGVVATLRVRM